MVLEHINAFIDAERPIGMFDSGIGGLTVFRRVQALLPNERIIYIADQANVPYGGRPLEQVRGLATNLSAELFDRGCKALVMACNISSAVALDDVAATYKEHPAVGMIVPGAAAAAVRTRTRRIGVLATEGTVSSQAYPQAFHRMDASLLVTQVACPDFVPIVEAGLSESPEAEAACRRYLEPILSAGIDTVVLGCTHYPYLLRTLSQVSRGRIAFVDPAEHTARALADRLARRGLCRTTPPEPHTLFTTGRLPSFIAQLGSMLDGTEHVTAQLVPRAFPTTQHELALTT